MKNPELKNFILQCLSIKKAYDVVEVFINNKAALAEYMIFASGTSIKNISMIAQFIVLQLKHKKLPLIGVEGINKSNWVSIDVQSIIIHLLHPEMRNSLKLEQFWQNKDLYY